MADPPGLWAGGLEGTMTGMKMMGARPEQSWLVGRDVVDMTRPAKAVRPIKLAALPQNIVVDANKSALIVVDMQNDFCAAGGWMDSQGRSEEHTSELQSLMRISYAVSCLKKKTE